jgi:hypothetical protein
MEAITHVTDGMVRVFDAQSATSDDKVTGLKDDRELKRRPWFSPVRSYGKA